MVALERPPRDAHALGEVVQLVERLVADHVAPPAAAEPPARFVDQHGHGWSLPAPLRETGAISDEAELQTAWTAAIGGGPAPPAALADVVARHREAHRRYHGVRHVTWVVRHVHELAAEVPLDDEAPSSRPRSSTTPSTTRERPTTRSRAPASPSGCSASLGWDAGAGAARSATSCGPTAAHGAPADDDTAVLLDADLAVLGSDPAAYQAYVTGVRAEYAHVDAPGWRAGRGQVLRDLLARDPLYATAAGRRRWARPGRRQHDGRARQPLTSIGVLEVIGASGVETRPADTRMRASAGSGRRRRRRTRTGIGCGVGARRAAAATAARAARALRIATSTACSVRVFGRTAKEFPSVLCHVPIGPPTHG